MKYKKKKNKRLSTGTLAKIKFKNKIKQKNVIVIKNYRAKVH